MKWVIVDAAGNVQLEDESKTRILNEAKEFLDDGERYDLYKFKTYVVNGEVE